MGAYILGGSATARRARTPRPRSSPGAPGEAPAAAARGAPQRRPLPCRLYFQAHPRDRHDLWSAGGVAAVALVNSAALSVPTRAVPAPDSCSGCGGSPTSRTRSSQSPPRSSSCCRPCATAARGPARGDARGAPPGSPSWPSAATRRVGRIGAGDKLEQSRAARGLPVQVAWTAASLRGQGRACCANRVRSYFQASRPAELHKARMVEEIADLDLVVTDKRDGGARPREQPHQAPRPPYTCGFRDDKNHPTSSSPWPRSTPPLRGAPPSEDGNGVRRPLHPGQPRPQDRRAREESSSASAPARRPSTASAPGRAPVPDPRCSGACVEELCSLERYRRSCEERSPLLEGRHRGGGEAAPRAVEQRAGTSVSRRRPRCAIRSGRSCAWRRPRRSRPPTSRSANLFAATSRATAAAVQAFSVRDGKVVAREGFLLDV